MAVAFVQSADTPTVYATSTTFTATLATGVTAGHWLVCQVVACNSTSTTVNSISGGGVTWTRGPTATFSRHDEIWYGATSAGTSGSTTNTVTLNQADNPELVVSEWSGVGTIGPTNTNSGTSTTESVPSITTTAANSVVVVTLDPNNYVTSTTMSGWTTLTATSYSGHTWQATYYQAFASAGAISGSLTLSSSGAWQSVGLTLSPAVAPTTNLVQMADTPATTPLTTTTVTLTSAVTAGNWLTCIVWCNSVLVNSVSGGGVTWTQRILVTPTGGNNYLAIWTGMAASSGTVSAPTITVTCGGPDYVEVSVAEWRNVSSFASQATNQGSGTTEAIPAFTTGSNNQLVIVATRPNNTINSASLGGSWTTLTATSYSPGIFQTSYYENFATSGTAISGSLTQSSAATWATAAIVFNTSGGGTSSPVFSISGAISTSSAVTVSTGSTGSYATTTALEPVIANNPSTGMASFWPGSPTSLRACKVIINWYSGSKGSLGSTAGNPVTEVANAWTQATCVATAPAGAYYATVSVSITGSTSGEVHYLDEAGLFPTQTTTWTPGGLLSTLTSTVTRSDGFVLRQSGQAIPASQQLVLTDYEWTPLQTYTYSAVNSAIEGTVAVGSQPSASNQITPTTTDWVMVDPLNTAGGILMIVTGFQVNQWAQQVAHYALGNSVPGVISDVSNPPGAAMTVSTFSTDDYDDLVAILTSLTTVWVSSPFGDGFYVRPGPAPGAVASTVGVAQHQSKLNPGGLVTPKRDTNVTWVQVARP